MEERGVPFAIFSPPLEGSPALLFYDIQPCVFIVEHGLYQIFSAVYCQKCHGGERGKQITTAEPLFIYETDDVFFALFVGNESEKGGKNVSRKTCVIGFRAVTEKSLFRQIKCLDKTFYQSGLILVRRQSERGSYLVERLDSSDVLGVYGYVLCNANLALGDVNIVTVTVLRRPLDHTPLIQIAQESVAVGVAFAIKIQDIGKLCVP